MFEATMAEDTVIGSVVGDVLSGLIILTVVCLLLLCSDLYEKVRIYTLPILYAKVYTLSIRVSVIHQTSNGLLICYIRSDNCV